MVTKLDHVQEDLRALITQTENSLSAYIGELEDRIQRTIENVKAGSERPI
jgi:hypothetical protein